MIYLLDTNILIHLIKEQPPAIAQWVDALPARRVLVARRTEFPRVQRPGLGS